MRSFGDMDVLVEVHDEAELARAIPLGARMIGINNRNLRSLAHQALADEQRADPGLVGEAAGIGMAGDAALADEIPPGAPPWRA
jgi:indole-3-glycerol phosphate synthase